MKRQEREKSKRKRYLDEAYSLATTIARSSTDKTLVNAVRLGCERLGIIDS